MSSNWNILSFRFLFPVHGDKCSLLILTASLVSLFWSVTHLQIKTLLLHLYDLITLKALINNKNVIFFRLISLRLPHFKASESMAFSIYHVQIRPLTSIDSAIDTVTIPALPQYQVYIANICQQGENKSSPNGCNEKQCGKILHHWKKKKKHLKKLYITYWILRFIKKKKKKNKLKLVLEHCSTCCFIYEPYKHPTPTWTCNFFVYSINLIRLFSILLIPNWETAFLQTNML